MDEMEDCIYRKEATEFIDKCLNHEEKLQSVERETLIAVKKNLENIPAADVRPVVRGKWVESKSMMEVVYCSECGFRTIYGAMPDGLGRNYSYCPNCGADMRDGNDGT